jgi:hypothetical protein
MRDGFIRKFTLSEPVDWLEFNQRAFRSSADLRPWHVLTAWRDETEHLLDRIDRAATERSVDSTRRYLDEKLKQDWRWKKVGSGLVLGDGKTVVFGQVLEGGEPGGMGARLVARWLRHRDLLRTEHSDTSLIRFVFAPVPKPQVQVEEIMFRVKNRFSLQTIDDLMAKASCTQANRDHRHHKLQDTVPKLPERIGRMFV